MIAVAAAVVLVPLLAAALLSLRTPVRGIVALYALVVPIGASTISTGLPSPFDTLSTVVGGVAVALVVAHLLTHRRRAALPGPDAAPALHRGLHPGLHPGLPRDLPAWVILVAVGLATTLWSVDPHSTLVGGIVLVSLVALYVAVALVDAGPLDRHLLELGIVGGGVAAGLYGAYLQVTDQMTQTAAGEPRLALIGAAEGDPNITAAALVLPLLIAGYHTLSDSGPQRFAWALAAVPVALAIALTGSRGAAVGITVGAVALIVDSRPRPGTVVALLTVAVTTSILLAPQIVGLLARFMQFGTTGRALIWRAGLDACVTHCWFGAGLGTFPQLYEPRALDWADAFGFALEYEAHNLWLSVATEAGLAGLAALLAGLVLFGARLMSVSRPARSAPLAGFVALLVTSSFLSSLGFKYFWLVLIYGAVAASADRVATAAVPPRSPQEEGLHVRATSTARPIDHR